MTKNTKQVYSVLAVVVVVAAVIWLFKAKPAAQSNPTNNGTGQQNSQNPNPEPTPANGTGTWTGTLEKSDNAKKGNLMLVTAERNIYMTSSRDFSQLFGKKVDVSYQGSLQSFVLGSISLSATQ